ncbi:MAG: hypothetical protein MZU91_01170 [Desulfosudis oleivorans]|nr:hypothetical protein [Desulfosudis oleivorans]
MCPGGHGGGRDLGGRPRGDQRHEPVLAQRAQRQRRHCGRHHAADYRQDGRRRPVTRWTASPSSAGWRRARSSSAAATTTPRASCVGDFLAGRRSTATRRRCMPSYTPGVR